MKRTPYTPKDFSWAKWTQKDIKTLVPKLLAEKKERLSVIKKVPKVARNFENTVYAIEDSDYGITDTILKIDLLQNVSPLKTIRDTAKKTIDTIQNKLIVIERDPRIWSALKDYEQGAWKKEQETLDPESKKLFLDMFQSYKRLGFDLSPQKQKRVRELSQRLAKVSNEFRQNINAYEDHILVTKDELDGLSERYKEGLKRAKDGRYKVTLAYPDYHPFIELATNEVKRKELAEKSLQKGGRKNMQVLGEMIKLRILRSHILGYKTHADYKLEPRMAKKGDHAVAFVNDLLKKVAKAGKQDIDELRDLKRKMTGDKKAVLYFYDIAYYGNELQKIKFKVDSEEVREYFPLERVIEGTFKIYSTLFDVKFKKLSGFILWHPDVLFYEVTSAKGEFLSTFALDLYPREGKYGHACVCDIVNGRKVSLNKNDYVAPFGAMLTNFPKPTSKNSSLLSHGEVETFLHEFGHMIHHTLTTAKFASQSGCHTAWDFVEAPSQMLEHWAWDKKPLALLSAHYKTGKPLPPTLLKNLLASKKHLLRYGILRQLILATLDLTIHTKNKPPEPAKLYRDLIKKYIEITLPKNAIFPAGFGHLEGYDAGYYGYLWSNVYAADMFTRFEKEGIMNKKTGADYKKWILEKGSSQEEINLVKGFLGRTPDNKAFLREIGEFGFLKP
ncbi:MAG: M3 family metallopeptidase [bacterium]|nr:M3 family metallopeptidase [bacterium]